MTTYPQRVIRFSYTEYIDVAYDSNIDLEQYVKRSDYTNAVDYYEAVIDFLIQAEGSQEIPIDYSAYQVDYTQDADSFKFLGEVNQWQG